MAKSSNARMFFSVTGRYSSSSSIGNSFKCFTSGRHFAVHRCGKTIIIHAGLLQKSLVVDERLLFLFEAKIIVAIAYKYFCKKYLQHVIRCVGIFAISRNTLQNASSRINCVPKPFASSARYHRYDSSRTTFITFYLFCLFPANAAGFYPLLGHPRNVIMDNNNNNNPNDFRRIIGATQRSCTLFIHMLRVQYPIIIIIIFVCI